MRKLLLVLCLLTLTESKPSFLSVNNDANHTPSDRHSRIIGGGASTTTWGWQLSLERLSGSWSHSCGAVLLQATKAITAAHCVYGISTSTLRVIAGVRDRSNMASAQISNLASFVIHERYQLDAPNLSNDIATLALATPITTNSDVFFATLPANNNNQFVGSTCLITGWGRVSSSATLPTILQEASIPVISSADCEFRMSQAGFQTGDNQICVFTGNQNVGTCLGDYGGPLNCPSGGYVVAGIASWGATNALGNCVQIYPSVYTRTSAYLTWINAN